MKINVTPTVPPWMVMVAHGWWLLETEGKEPCLYVIWEYNVSNLIPMGHQSRSGFGGGTYKTTTCRVRKIND